MRQFNLTRFPRLKELAGLVFLVAAVALLAALLSYNPTDPSWNTASGRIPPSNKIGRVGAYLADFSFQIFGLAAWLLPLLFCWFGWRWVRSKEIQSLVARAAGYVFLATASSGLLALTSPPHPWSDAFPAGGIAGFLLASGLEAWLNYWGTLLLLGTVLTLSLYLVSSFSIAGIAERAETNMRGWFGGFRWRKLPPTEPDAGQVAGEVLSSPGVVAQAMEEKRNRRKVAVAGAGYGAVALTPPGLAADLADLPLPIQDQVMAQEAALLMNGGGHNPSEPPAYTSAAVLDDAPPWDEDIPIRTLEDSGRGDRRFEDTLPPPTPKPKREEHRVTHFRLPPTHLLNAPPERQGYDSFELKDVATRIKAKLEEFNVLGNVVQINPGPVVTTFEFKPDAGVKIAKITTLSEDLCLGLQAESILIERIPGKPTVGIEVPNTRRETIALREIIEADEFSESGSKLTVALGKDISGRLRVTELEKMPHLLIAGSTGSGKSVMLNTLIMSMIYKSTPDEVRMIMVDPKRVELGIYDGIPHLLTPVITEPKKAVNALRNAVLEMERRLKLLASYGVRNIDQFNRKIRQKNEKPLSLFDEEKQESAAEERPLPYILIVIDELADLMMLERAGVEESVIRLAQMARAVGMHLVLATQRPSVDVITGLIKANFPARISFRVATRVDSRTVLDVMGAEHLLGKGDMLFLPPGTSRLLRVHGAFVTESEITEVVDFWRKQAQPEYDQSYLLAPPSEDGDSDEPEEFDGEEDPLFRDAVKVVLEMGKASTSILQRRLRLGYGRAARILDMMQRDGIIGPPDGSRPRDVLKRPDWLDDVDGGLR
jgi:S-DNA-T family DNA segregation ATPase FtsK/SpoIIIE